MIFFGKINLILNRVSTWLKKIAQTKRKRLTTWRAIAQQVAYLDSFEDLGYFIPVGSC